MSFVWPATPKEEFETYLSTEVVPEEPKNSYPPENRPDISPTKIGEFTESYVEDNYPPGRRIGGSGQSYDLSFQARIENLSDEILSRFDVQVKSCDIRTSSGKGQFIGNTRSHELMDPDDLYHFIVYRREGFVEEAEVIGEKVLKAEEVTRLLENKESIAGVSMDAGEDNYNSWERFPEGRFRINYDIPFNIQVS